jgi:hypothetical protein
MCNPFEDPEDASTPLGDLISVLRPTNNAGIGVRCHDRVPSRINQ